MCADEEEQVDVWLTHIHAAIHNDQSAYEFARFDPEVEVSLLGSLFSNPYIS
jgi:hypothetical protein